MRAAVSRMDVTALANTSTLGSLRFRDFDSSPSVGLGLHRTLISSDYFRKDFSRKDPHQSEDPRIQGTVSGQVAHCWRKLGSQCFAYAQMGCLVFKLRSVPLTAEQSERCQHRLRIYPAGTSLRARTARRDHSYSED